MEIIGSTDLNIIKSKKHFAIYFKDEVPWDFGFGHLFVQKTKGNAAAQAYILLWNQNTFKKDATYLL